jgi:RNA polymerase sigma-70 factor (ECF subfamily)
VTLDGTAERRRQFDTLVRPLIPSAYRLAVGLLQNRVEAEDAVQEAAFKAWRRFDTFQTGMDMRPWFLAIVANECRSLRRARWWSVIRLGEPPAAAAVLEDRLVQSEDLRLALRRLSHERRLVVVLHFYLDLPFEQVAAIVGDSVEAVKSRVYRALREMRPELEVHEGIG